MKVTAYSTVTYEFEMEIPEEISEDLDGIIDYLLTEDPTDLVDKNTGEHWDGFNYGCLNKIYFHELDKTFQMEDC